MSNHIWRPLYLVIAFATLVVAAGLILVPEDFGSHEQGYMYGWYRKSNEADWKAMKVKYRTSGFCETCHKKVYLLVAGSPHAGIMCENCHGPALSHPRDPATLPVDRSRELCIRCHSFLPYHGSGRKEIRGIDPQKHHPEVECVLCHYPHDPRQEARR